MRAGEGTAGLTILFSLRLGIDLGTTYSCVGVWQNDRVEIIANVRRGKSRRRVGGARADSLGCAYRTRETEPPLLTSPSPRLSVSLETPPSAYRCRPRRDDRGADKSIFFTSRRNQAAMNPRQTVFDAKRLIGRRFDDSDVKKDMVHWPFKVVDKEGSPFIEVRWV